MHNTRVCVCVCPHIDGAFKYAVWLCMEMCVFVGLIVHSHLLEAGLFPSGEAQWWIENVAMTFPPTYIPKPTHTNDARCHPVSLAFRFSQFNNLILKTAAPTAHLIVSSDTLIILSWVWSSIMTKPAFCCCFRSNCWATQEVRYSTTTVDQMAKPKGF